MSDMVLLAGQLQGPPRRSEVRDTALPSRGFPAPGWQGWASPLPEKPLDRRRGHGCSLRANHAWYIPDTSINIIPFELHSKPRGLYDHPPRDEHAHTSKNECFSNIIKYPTRYVSLVVFLMRLLEEGSKTRCRHCL